MNAPNLMLAKFSHCKVIFEGEGGLMCSCELYCTIIYMYMYFLSCCVKIMHVSMSCWCLVVGVYRNFPLLPWLLNCVLFFSLPGLPDEASVHCYAGPTTVHLWWLLDHGLGAELLHHCHAHTAGGEREGEALLGETKGLACVGWKRLP